MKEGVILKRLLASLLTLSVMFSMVVTGAVPAAAAEAENEDASKYVELDGEWHYKLYRTYSQMFQYFPFMPALSLGNWTDAEAAVLPDKDTWESWDTYQMPYDNPETGGLLTDDLSPTWSEAWVVREFDLPADFTEEDEVTLLLGIIDDNDVVYINGQAVAASGFADGNGNPIIDVPETGGFNYTAEDPADQVKWVKSYWEIQREYTIPAEVLNLGDTNEIAIRLYNNNSFGGFYAGNLYAICGNELAVRELKGLPTELVDCPEVLQAVEAQNAAVADGDIDAYADTIAEDYHNDAADKAAMLAEVEALMEAYDSVTVTDENAAVYVDDEGFYWYSADRTIAAGEEVIAADTVELCFDLSGDEALERGNWNRCYGTSYSSELFGEQLTYSVYLPPSYYESKDKFPVVWLLHGRASSSTSYRDVDDIGAFMDELIDDGEVVEMVVIMPDSGKYAFYSDSELTPGDKDNSGPWATQLTEELRAEVADNYRVLTKAEFNGLTGNSMGGYGSMVIGTSNPDLYSSIGVHMGYLPEDALESLKSLSEDELAEYDFYLDCGLQDTTVYPNGTIAVHEYLESVDKEHGYDLRDGGHNSAFYMSGMADSMKMHSDHFLANGLGVEDPAMYVELDGEWHYKLYRTYSQMFQYFPFMPALSLGSWTDAEAAVLPDKDTWESWDTYQMPYDNPETGGLLTNELSPTWSEAWVVREFDLPEGFTDNDEVTLLMGIIDDNDVIYINGQAVAASGFADGNGNPIIDVPETGGFNYTAADPEDQVKWVKSYWEIQREYTIPAEVLNQGGTNEIAVRLYNNNSFGGFYSGNLYAICGNELAVRALKGLPTELVDAPAVERAVASQNAALAAEDDLAYYLTVDKDYHNDAADRDDKMAEVEALMEAYDDIAVIDENAAVYMDDEGYYWYSADRTITAGEEVISAGPVELCFKSVKGGAREIGNRSRCYGTSYSSELFGEDLTYSVYLPPSYYEDEDSSYPVVWLLHGRASSSTSYRDVDDIGAFMDGLIDDGEVMEMVVIMPDSGKYAFYSDSELTPGDKDNSGPWATQLTEELRAEIQDNYRVLDDAEFNGLTGNSMGGYGSMVIGTSNPDLYSSIGVHMGYLPEDALESLKSLSMEQLAAYDFYLDCGLQDTTVYPNGTIAVHEYLESVEKEHGYDLRDGGHNSAFYMSGMADSMKMHSDHFEANGADKAGQSGGSSVVVKPNEPADKPDKPVEPDEPADEPDEPVKPVEKDPSEAYVDLDENAWYAEAVDYVISEGLMTGISEDEFAPADQITRAAMVQILWALEGKPVVNYAMDFEDVAQDAWYAEAVRWAVSEGIASGVSESEFAPNAAITREQLAVMLYRVEQANDGGFTGLWMFDLDYADADAVSEWAYEAVCWCTMKGIISGRDDGSLDPQGTALRSECAQMLMQYASL